MQTEFMLEPISADELVSIEREWTATEDGQQRERDRYAPSADRCARTYEAHERKWSRDQEEKARKQGSTLASAAQCPDTTKLEAAANARRTIGLKKWKVVEAAFDPTNMNAVEREFMYSTLRVAVSAGNRLTVGQRAWLLELAAARPRA